MADAGVEKGIIRLSNAGASIANFRSLLNASVCQAPAQSKRQRQGANFRSPFQRYHLSSAIEIDTLASWGQFLCTIISQEY
jgi:hypothetical protein